MLVAGIVAIPALAMLATAADQPYCQSDPRTGSFHCFSQYEAGSDVLSLRVSCDQLPAALCPADGHFDFGGVMYDGGRSSDHAINGGDSARDLPVFTTGPGGSVFDEKIYVHDAVFGQNVGVFYCQDVDGDGLCGEGNLTQPGPSEPAVLFCGHVDLGPIDTSTFVWAGYYIVGPLFQQRDCPGSTNLVGATTGTLSIWLTPVPVPPPPPPTHDGIDYGVWGGVGGGQPRDPPPPQPNCQDGVDNDGDGFADFEDRDCHFNRDCKNGFNPEGTETDTSPPAGCTPP